MNQKFLDVSLIIHETAWREKVRSGKVSPSDVERIKSSGIVPTEHQYLKGLVKGTRNINKKTGAEISHHDSILGPTAIGTDINLPYKGKDTLLDPKLINVNDPMNRAVLNRHETDEVKYGSQLIKKLPPNRMVVKPAAIIKSRFGVKVGQHFSPKVLDQERQNVNFANSMYGKASDLKKFRDTTGEYDAISNMSKKQMNKVKPATISTKHLGRLKSDITGFFSHPVKSVSNIKKHIDYQPGTGPIQGKGSSIPVTIGSLKQIGKILGKKILRRAK